MNNWQPIEYDYVCCEVPKMHWSVTVERNGEKVVTIEAHCLSGREISPEDEQAIRTAAHHLLSFIGDPAPVAPREGGR